MVRFSAVVFNLLFIANLHRLAGDHCTTQYRLCARDRKFSATARSEIALNFVDRREMPPRRRHFQILIGGAA
jgi:hypothetical protein